MKRIDKIVRSVLLMLLGAMIYGFISSAAEVYGSRGNGNIGGEALILPLMIGLVWLGWQIRADIHK